MRCVKNKISLYFMCTAAGCPTTNQYNHITNTSTFNKCIFYKKTRRAQLTFIKIIRLLENHPKNPPPHDLLICWYAWIRSVHFSRFFFFLHLGKYWWWCFFFCSLFMTGLKMFTININMQAEMQQFINGLRYIWMVFLLLLMLSDC